MYTQYPAVAPFKPAPPHNGFGGTSASLRGDIDRREPFARILLDADSRDPINASAIFFAV